MSGNQRLTGREFAFLVTCTILITGLALAFSEFLDLAPTGHLDTRSQVILSEVDSFADSLGGVLETLEEVTDTDLEVAEVPGRPDLSRCLEQTQVIREDRLILAGLRAEVSQAAEELRLSTKRLRAGEKNLDSDTCTAIENTLNALRASRLTLRDTAGDIARKAAEMPLEQAAHNWAGVTSRIETIRAIQEVRIEELRNILTLLANLQRLLR